MKKLLSIWPLVVLLAAPVAAPTPLEDPPVYRLQWGSPGQNPGEFSQPHGVATDAESNVYVADAGNNRVQVFTASGAFLRQWAAGSIPRGIAVSDAGLVYVARTVSVAVYSPTGAIVDQWGQVWDPHGIAVNSAGEVYVSDTGSGRVQKFSSDGDLLTYWGSGGSAPGEFGAARGIALDSKGNVYVADYLNGRIQKFDPDGGFITTWSTGLWLPVYVAIDQADHVYVTDEYLNQCLKFTSDGAPIFQWGSTGTGPGQFASPRGIAVDGLGRVFVVEATPFGGHSRVQRFDPIATAAQPGTWGSLKAKYR